MSGRLSNSPPQADGWSTRHDGKRADSETGSGFDILSRCEWPGVELLLCREDIRRPTHWALDQPRHTVIVHLGGAMRRLDTEIEGAGRCRMSPSPGDIWLVPGGYRYASQAQGHVITYAELRIEPNAAVELPDTVRALDAMAPRLGHRDEFLYWSVAELAKLASADDDLAGMMGERLQHLLRQHLFRSYRVSATASRSRILPHRFGPVLARRISDCIEDRLGERITLAELAEVAGMSVHRLLIAFRESFGTTPAQYVLARRLARVRWLLLNSDQDIAGIAFATGFASHSHLSAAFRRRLGVSPSRFRDGLRTHAQRGAE